MNARFFFFEAKILGLEFHFSFFFLKKELSQFSRQHIDRTVFLNDSNCYWQSIRS